METISTELPTVRVASLHGIVPMWGLKEFYDAAYTRIRKTAARAGWDLTGPAVGWYHGMPTDEVDLTVGFVVDGLDTGTVAEGVEVREMPGGPALVLTYTGPYDGLPRAWERLEQDRVALAVEGRGDFWEEYVTEPSPDGDASRNVTRLVLPLRAA